MEAANTSDRAAFDALEQEIESLVREPAGAGLDPGDSPVSNEDVGGRIETASRIEHASAGQEHRF